MSKPGQKITAKQEKACQVFIETGCKTTAYRDAYNVAKMKAATINRRAFELFETDMVMARVGELQAEHRAVHDVTIDGLTTKLNAAYDMAKNNGQTAVMVQAAMGIAKLHGLLIDKTEEVKPTAEMTDAELRAESERIDAELKELDRADNVIALPTGREKATYPLHPPEQPVEKLE